MTVCFICFEEREEAICRQICPTCVGSTICQTCEREALNSTVVHDALSNCPMCRRQVDTERRNPPLFTFWHPTALLLWWFEGLDVGLWQQMMVLFMSHSYLSSICRTINVRDENGRPSLLLQRWRLTCMVIHIPYFIYQMTSRHLSTDHHLNSYLMFHLAGPVIVKTFLQGIVHVGNFIRNRTPQPPTNDT
jgi:hypothetical protein